MATNYTNTLAGLIVLNDQNLADIYPSDVLNDAPVIARATAIPASQGGTVHKYIQRTTAAGAGFRDLATGVANAAETFTDQTLVCEILDASFDRDVMLADAYRKGRDAYVEKETLAALKSAMYGIESALFTNVADSFNGLLQWDDYSVYTAATGQVIDTGGAGGKSVWLIRWAEDAVAIVAGNDGNMSMLWDNDNPTVVRITDDTGNPYSAYRVTLSGYYGLQVGSKYDVVRIANLDGTSDDLLTDDLLAQAISKFPAGRGPNMICMNRTAQKELREGRTATNPTGAPAEFPTQAFGVPIVVTDALGVAEATVVSTTTATTHSTQTS